LLNTEDGSIMVLRNVSNCQSTKHNITEGLNLTFRLYVADRRQPSDTSTFFRTDVHQFALLRFC